MIYLALEMIAQGQCHVIYYVGGLLSIVRYKYSLHHQLSWMGSVLLIFACNNRIIPTNNALIRIYFLR